MPKSTSSPKITINQAKSALIRSGYLLEARAETILEESGFYVEANTAYPDPNTGKGREIDLYAVSANFISKKKYDAIFYVFITECLNNPQPFAFITKDSFLSSTFHYDLKLAGLPIRIIPSEEDDDSIPLVEFLRMDEYHHYCRGRISTQFCSFRVKKGSNEWMALHDSPHFEAFQKLCEATDYYREEYVQNWEIGDNEVLNLEIYYPLIILQGDLMDVRPIGKSAKLSRTNHILYRRTTIQQGKSRDYFIDVITESFLPDYIKMVEGEIQKAVNLIRRHKGRITASIEDIVERAQKAKDKKEIRRLLVI